MPTTPTSHTNARSERWIESADGTLLYYTLSGSGELDILLCDGIGCDGFIWPYLRPYLEEHGRVIHLHMRGHGLSDEPKDPTRVSIADLASDWEVVMRAEGAVGRPVVALGHSMGVQVALELYRQQPSWRWLGLALLCGTFEHTASNVHETQMLERALPMLRKAADVGGEALNKLWRRIVRFPLAVTVAQRTEVSATLTRKRDIERYLKHLARMKPNTFLAMLSAASEHSARAYLGDVKVPTLVIAGERDKFTPARLSEEMAALLPQPQLEVIKEGTHVTPIEHTIEVNQLVRRWLTQLMSAEGLVLNATQTYPQATPLEGAPPPQQERL